MKAVLLQAYGGVEQLKYRDAGGTGKIILVP